MNTTSDELVKKLAQDVSEIKDALLGTEYIKKGLVIRVEELEHSVESLKSFKLKVGGAAAGIAAVISSVLSFVLSKTF